MKKNVTTTVSAKGQVVLPKATREEMGWGPGAKLRVQITPDGILLSEDRAFPKTSLAEVFGRLSYDGPAKTVEEMNEAILKEARRQG